MRSSSAGSARITRGSVNLEDSDSSANRFADFFESVYNKDETSAPSVTSNHIIDVSTLDISIGEIYRCILSLPVNISPGIDDVPSILLKECNFIISRPLWIIFNKSLGDGIFPSRWKKCLIQPIFKGGDESLVSNYRPICKQNIMSKVFDLIVTDKLGSLCKSVVMDEQHGFMSGRSTTTNLMAYHKYISARVESGLQVDSVYTDFSKAFDTVSHPLLISKLHAIGIYGTLLRWLSNFLSNRTQFVKHNGYLSRPIAVASGVPQGSHIGPLLFNLFINDIANQFKYSKFLLYADDLKIYRRVDNLDDALLLQSDLSELEIWCKTNRLKLNPSKCHVVHFSRRIDTFTYDYDIGHVTLETVLHIRDLGVTFSFNLSFSQHVRDMVSAAYKSLGFVFRWSKYFSVNTLRLLYCALIRPKLEYCSVIWSPYLKYQDVMIERLQHKFLRLASYRLGEPIPAVSHDYTGVLTRLNLLTLHKRRDIADHLFIFKIINHYVECPCILEDIKLLVLPRMLRHTPLFQTSQNRTLYGRYSGINRLCILANSISEQIDYFHGSISSFKRQVTKALT